MYKCTKSDLDEIKTVFDTLEKGFNMKATQGRNLVGKLKDEKDCFKLNMPAKIDESEKLLAKLKKRYEDLRKEWAEVCDYYSFKKDDPKRENGPAFFTFFTELYDQISKAFPKEKKPPKAKFQPKHQVGAKLGAPPGLANVLAEMKDS